MEHSGLGCQVCLTNCNGVSHFKSHMRSKEHQQKMEEVFQKDVDKGLGFFPFIIIMDPLAKRDIKHPIIGLSLVTLCFSPATKTFFYLCHVCEEKCRPNKILNHLSSGDHCSGYLNYTDPNALSFSWMPSMDMRVVLRSQIAQKVKEGGSGTLQMLALPENLIEKLEGSTYSEVMHALSENEKLLKLFEAAKPKRTLIQTYQSDSNRKHPLLGMQHLVECICVGPSEKRHYLCTLCNLTMATHTIIKHVLSFDHIFSYFKAWHPSTLLSKECYKNYTMSFASMMLNLAKETEEIHGTPNTDMKQVSLEPAEYKSVNFNGYAEALKKLESITKENNGSSLITSIKPGNKLECCTVRAAFVASSYKLRCQDCGIVFETISQYFKHLLQRKHKEMLKKFCREEGRDDGYEQTAHVNPCLASYKYLQESLERNRPVIGVSLVVACVSAQVQTDQVYMCFACQDCFTEPVLRKHFKSQKHLIHTLLYQNPWRLPFAWKNSLDEDALKSGALEEQEERGPSQMVLKVLDVPYRIFQNLIPPSYSKVIERLELHHTLLKNGVPQCETYSKLKQNERFPLLGKQFMVMHDVCVKRHQSTEKGFLCLLCKRRLSDDECYAHVFSREHVVEFLNHFHPGSVSSSTDAETILDLAKQAGRIHPISHVQEIPLDTPIWEPCTYKRAKLILASAKRRHGRGMLEPPIKPTVKLFPRKTLQEVDEDQLRQNSQKNGSTMEGSENKTSQKPADNNENTPKKNSPEHASENINKCSVESEENAEKGTHEETTTPSDKESEKRREASSQTSPEEVNKSGGETCQLIKQEIIEEATTREPSGEIPESCHNTGKDGGAETGKDAKDVVTQVSRYTCEENERKRPYGSSEKPQEATGREMEHKRQRLTSDVDASCEEPEKMPSGGSKGVTAADKRETGKAGHETAKDASSPHENKQHQQANHLWEYVKMKSREPVVGVNALLECHCEQHGPIYLCECCSLTIPEKNVISHVIGFEHQKMYLMGVQKVPPAPGQRQRRKIRHLAALYEQNKGYGEAQVLDLDAETYNTVLKQDFNSAIKTVKALQTQEYSGHGLPSTSASPDVQPALTSVTVHAQRAVCSMMNNTQLVESDDVDDSKAQPSSATAPASAVTETTSTTTKVQPQSNAVVKMSRIEAPKSADNANTGLTVSRSSEEASAPRVSRSGTNTSILRSDSTGNNLQCKDKIAPNTTVKPLKRVTFSEVVGSSQTAAFSHSTVSTPTTHLTAISKCTAKPSTSTPDTTKSTAAACNVTATASNSPTATVKLRDTAHRCVAATSSATATTTKLTAANPSSSKASISTSATSSCATAAVKCRETDYKCTATTPSAAVAAPKSTTTTTVCAAATSKYTAASSRLTATTIPNTPSTTKSTTVSKPLESRTGAASVVAAASRKPAATSLTAAREATRRATPQTTVKTSDKREDAEVKPVHIKSKKGANADIAPHTHQSNPPAAPHPTAASSVRSEHKSRPTEPPHASSAKTKPREKPPEVGLNQLVKVTCKGRQQVYCLLCTVRLKNSSHLSSTTHQLKCVKMRYSGFTAKPSELESKLDKIVPNLAEVEKDIGCRSHQPMEVQDDVYKQLAALPDHKAVERVKAMMKQRSPSWSRTDTADTVRQPGAFSSPCEVSSPDYDPLATESAGILAQTPETCRVTPENGQQQERSDPEVQDAEKTSPVSSPSPDPLSSAASANPEQQDRSRPTVNAEHVQKHPGCSSGPGQCSAAQALPSISVGELSRGYSNLSSYLMVMGLDTEPVIGLGSVWELQGTSVAGKSQKTLYLCESCSKTISHKDICQHMVSPSHQLKYMRWQYPQFVHFWLKEWLTEHMKLEILKEVAEKLSVRERLNRMDAQGVMLRQEIYEYVRTAPFSEALKIVQDIKKMSLLRLPISTTQQSDKQPEKQQNQEESLPVETLETDQRRDNGARQKEENHLEGETAMAGDLDGVRHRTVVTSLDATSVSSEADSVFSPIHGADTRLSPREACGSPFMQPEVRPPVSQHQRPVHELQVKHVEVHSESQSFSAGSPKATQTLSASPRDKCVPTRKRPADTSVETLVRPRSSNSELEDPLPAKCICSSLQQHRQPSPEPAPEPTSVHPAATSTPLCQQDENTGPESDKHKASKKPQFSDLLALIVRERESQVKTIVSPCMSAADTAETTSSCATSGVEGRWDSKIVREKSKQNRMRWNSKCQLVTATVKKNPPSTTSLDGMCSETPPLLLSAENQHSSPDSSPFLSANSPLEVHSTGDTMLPSLITADHSELQYQRSICAQNVVGNVGQLRPNLINCVANNHNAGQVSQPQGSAETDTSQQAVDRIITARPDATSQQLMSSCIVEDHTEVNRGPQVTHSSSTVEMANPSNALAASGGRGQYSQRAHVTNGHSGHLLLEGVAGYTAPGDPPVYSRGFYQQTDYTACTLSPSQIHPEQEANRFSLQSPGHSLATSAASQWVSLEMQQRQQQQHASCTSATLAAGDGSVASDQAYLGAVPFATNSSQGLINPNQYSTIRIVPTQDRSNIVTQSASQVYLGLPAFHYPPTYTSGIVSLPAANSFFTSGAGVFTGAPSVVGATHPNLHTP